MRNGLTFLNNFCCSVQEGSFSTPYKQVAQNDPQSPYSQDFFAVISIANHATVTLYENDNKLLTLVVCIPNSASAIQSSVLAVLAVRQHNISCSPTPSMSYSGREFGQTTLPKLASSRVAWGTCDTPPPSSRRLEFPSHEQEEEEDSSGNCDPNKFERIWFIDRSAQANISSLSTIMSSLKEIGSLTSDHLPVQIVLYTTSKVVVN